MANAKALAGRMERLRALMSERGYDAVIIRNNPDLRWLTGAERTFDEETAHTAFITLDKMYLHTDSRYYGTFVKRLGSDTPWILDEQIIAPATWAAQRAAENRSRVVAVEDTVDLNFYDAFLEACNQVSISVMTPRLHSDIADKLRAVKDEEELELMREAQRITDDCFRHIIKFIKAGMTELDVRVEMDNFMLSHGAEALSFPTLVAAGPNGANPHAQPSDYVIKEHDMIVLDYGACYHDYHADMTRTVCVGEPTEEERKVYDIVRATNEACQKAIHTGVIGKDIHFYAVELITKAGYGEYFNHGLGHGVGVEVHEMPSFSRAYDKPIPTGAVITDEPGIYLPDKFGVRIEDCGLIDEQGYHPFSEITHDLICVG